MGGANLPAPLSGAAPEDPGRVSDGLADGDHTRAPRRSPVGAGTWILDAPSRDYNSLSFVADAI